MLGRTLACALLLVSLLSALPAWADIAIPGADGGDGPFAFTGDPDSPDQMTIDLGLAATLPLDSAFPYPGSPPVPGNGVYDPSRWAVVYRYSDVSIPAGKTVKFKNHSSGAPVVWLVSGNVTIGGTVDLSGEPNTGLAYRQSIAGPGGWRGGRATQSEFSLGSAGFGPGGGRYPSTYPGHAEIGNGGSYSTPGFLQTASSTYGSASLTPLFGGSGGGAASKRGGLAAGGGAGGGALLIAGGGSVLVSGALKANGGDDYIGCTDRGGPGGGGAIRIIAGIINSTGTLSAQGGTNACDGNGGYGRIRLEANSTSLSGTISPSNAPGFSEIVPPNPPEIFPDASAPTVRVTHVGVASVPIDPQPLARWEFPNADVSIDQGSPTVMTIECTNVPVPPDPQAWSVAVRVVPKTGDVQELNATYVDGDQAHSTWTCEFTPPPGHSAIQARAIRP